jgi:hypothetical protein
MQWGSSAVTLTSAYTGSSFLPSSDSVTISWKDILPNTVAPELNYYSSLPEVGMT